MGRNHSLQLSIPQPCSENWDNMTPNERGRHCNSCNKTIIDFSLYSDRQLIEFIEKVQGKICGRLSPAQVNRPITYTEPRNNFLYKLLFGSALTVGITCSANANYNPNQRPLDEQYEFSKNNINTEHPEGDTAARVIEGAVKDDGTKIELPFASVDISYKGEIIGSALTDVSGKYKIIIPSKFNNDELTIIVSYIGYKHFEEKIKPSKKHAQFNIKLQVEAMTGLMEVKIMYEAPRDPDPTHQTWRKGDTPIY